MNEKIEKMRAAFLRSGVAVNDFAIAARIQGLTNNDFGERIYDLAGENGLDDDDLPELIESEVKNTLEGEEFQREIYLAKSGLSRRQQYYIRKRPLDQWRGVSRKKKQVIEFRFCNHDVFNKYFAKRRDEVEANGVSMEVFGGALSFFDQVIYSALMTLFDKKQDRISYRALLEFLDPACKWRRGGHEAWIEAVNESAGRLNQVGIVIGGESSALIQILADDEGLTVKGYSQLWRKANEQSRVFPIPHKYLESGHCRINWLERLFAARRVLSAASPKSSVKAAIDLVAMGRALGYAVSAAVIQGYLDCLADKGLLNSVKMSNGVIAWTPIFKPSKEAQNTVTSVVKEVVRGEDGKPLRNAAGAKIKREIEVPMTDEAKRRDEAIKAYNEYISRQTVTLYGKHLDCRVKAEYLDNFEKCGRLYTNANGHQVKGRENIIINGQKTVEVDFACYHAKMLYDSIGLALQGDAYDFLADRDHAKKTLNILLNADNEGSAKGAIKTACGVDYDKAAEYIASAKTRHPALSPYFHCGRGVYLQNNDAAIMLNILAKLMGMRIPALPVHDSVIIPAKDEAKAIDAMREAYKEAVGSEARLKVEKVEMRKYDATELQAYK